MWNGSADSSNGRTVALPFRAKQAVTPLWAEAVARPALDRLLFREGIELAAAVVGPAGELLGSVGATAFAPLVIGRHENCDLRLLDPSIALRQCVLLRGHARPGAHATTHVWDLRTDCPLVTVEGQNASALRAHGAFTLRFGGYALVVRTRDDSTGPLTWLERGRVVARAFEPADPELTVTRVQPLSYLGEALPQDPVVATLEARLHGHEDATHIPVTLSEFRSGVLIGRYPRCAVRASQMSALSRVHVLLAEVDGQPTAVDLASTNGTTVNGAGISASPLGMADVLRCSAVELRWGRAAMAA